MDKVDKLDRVARLQELVDEQDAHTMASGHRRKEFGKTIASELNLQEAQVHSFVREMQGLNFYKVEDRKAFVDFFYVAFPKL